MRTARVLTGTALTIAALGLASGPALAVDVEKLEVTPDSAQPGTMVTVNTTTCGAGGAAMGDASAVGGPASFELKPGTQKEVVVGQFTVPAKARAGTYGIGVRCKSGKEATGDLVVTAKDGAMAPATAPTMAPSGGMKTAPATAPATAPSGGMKTGVGSTSDDSGMAEIVAGAAILATAAVGGTWFMRRRGDRA
ncbi:hypothetical protein [Streptomyces sp. ISL-11]|uniref:hypothetical protein n=1 Tax=Streptomyces sp. ISL-11 TaxID=2819174 RepID=UPI001BE95260|nr:hypothetical protein [Streptomyces sp. ISL-11]MBT2382148.1 hypothetical protein [Streptomyces sp. ISL-11]